MSREKMIHQANQIAANFAAYGHDQAVAETAAHIRRFWDPVKRAALAALLAEGGEGLQPIARDAAAIAARPTSARSP